MQSRKTISPSSSWISLTDWKEEEIQEEENVKENPFYSEYPATVIYADSLPPDYPAILSLLCSIIAICWTVRFVIF